MNGGPLLLALLLAATAALQCIVPAAAAASAEMASHGARCASPEIAAASVRRATRRLCDSQPIADALASVQLGDDIMASTAAELLSNTLGIRTALDLQLLEAGEPEAEELFDSLKAGGLTVGARAKIRLLQQRGSEGGRTAEQRPPDLAPHLRDGLMDSGGSLHSEGDAAQGGRALQEDSSGGMSVDTIAIVLSVLVGGAGYVMQAITARRAEHAQQDQDRQNHFAEMRRQREHEQMVAQIKRTDRWLDDCCRPLSFHLEEMKVARLGCMGDLAVELEANHPEVVQALMAKVLSMFSIDEDGALKTPYGKAIWKPHQPAILRTYEDGALSFPMVGAVAIATIDMFQSMSAALCSVAPQPILDVIAATPTGSVAQNYRGYIRTVFVPLLRRMVDIMVAHGASIEWPTKEYLKETYPAITWDLQSNSLFGIYNGAYVRAWDRIIEEEWGAEVFTTLQPSLGFAYMGLLQTVQWSQQRGEAKQTELIGMTAVEELDVDALFDRVKTGREEQSTGE